MMPTLSMLRPFASAGFEVPLQAFGRGDSRGPADPGLQLVIAVAGLLPVGIPAPAVEDRRQLLLRPIRVPLPKPAEGIAGEVRQIDRREPFHSLLVEAQKPAARGKLVIDHVENLAIDAGG